TQLLGVPRRRESDDAKRGCTRTQLANEIHQNGFTDIGAGHDQRGCPPRREPERGVDVPRPEKRTLIGKQSHDRLVQLRFRFDEEDDVDAGRIGGHAHLKTPYRGGPTRALARSPRAQRVSWALSPAHPEGAQAERASAEPALREATKQARLHPRLGAPRRS